MAALGAAQQRAAAAAAVCVLLVQRSTAPGLAPLLTSLACPHHPPLVLALPCPRPQVPETLDVLLVEQEIVGTEKSALEAVVAADAELMALREEEAEINR